MLKQEYSKKQKMRKKEATECTGRKFKTEEGKAPFNGQYPNNIGSEMGQKQP